VDDSGREQRGDFGGAVVQHDRAVSAAIAPIPGNVPSNIGSTMADRADPRALETPVLWIDSPLG
jgi:hypothetical protein